MEGEEVGKRRGKVKFIGGKNKRKGRIRRRSKEKEDGQGRIEDLEMFVGGGVRGN